MNRAQPCSGTPCTCGRSDQPGRADALVNPPGQRSVRYRLGTQARFLQALTAGLSGRHSPALAALGTRERRDFTLGLLDAWASVADVLSFYQERIAQEGYLRTATERRSVLELARLVGYQPRPGVAASLHLAYTLDAGAQTTIPRGSRAQSVPRPGELPQSFETSDDLKAEAALNALRPRLTRPPHLTPANLRAAAQALYVRGVDKNLKTGDLLLASFDHKPSALLRVLDARPDLTRVVTALDSEVLDGPPAGVIAAPQHPALTLLQRYERYAGFGIPGVNQAAEKVLAGLREWSTNQSTLANMQALVRGELSGAQRRGSLRLADWLQDILGQLESLTAGGPNAVAARGKPDEPLSPLARLSAGLLKPASSPPASAQALSRNLGRLYDPESDLLPALHGALFPTIRTALYQAYTNASAPTNAPLTGLEVLRVQANLFGYNAPPLAKLKRDGEGFIPDPQPATLREAWAALVSQVAAGHGEWPTQVVALDREYPDIKPGSGLVIVRPRTAEAEGATIYALVKELQVMTLSVNGLSARATVLTLDRGWLERAPDGRDAGQVLLTNTRVYAAGEPLTVADEPLLDEVNAAQIAEDGLELDGLYRGLESGRWVILTGERTDLPGTISVPGTELLMVASVDHRFEQVADDNQTFHDRPGDTRHTFVRFVTPPAYRYRRETVTLNANVVKATHGETKTEVLGSGDASQAFQAFALKQPPLTYTSAPTAAGADSTLEVQVNGVVWPETDSFVGLSPGIRAYQIQVEDDGQTRVVFGNGVQGARLPSGAENVRATYRSGLGRVGNVAERQVSLLLSRPLGVKEVINPLPASGGADRESRDQARKNAPRAVLALDRLVSVRDYADFAQTVAGIGKASAAELSSGAAMTVHVTVAGAQDAPIDVNGDLYRNLKEALKTLGDPYQPLELAVYARKLLVIQAGVRVRPEARWANVEPLLRAALLDTFSFEARELGQGVAPSEVLAAIQAVPGVEYADLNVLGALGWEELKAGTPLPALSGAAPVRVSLAGRGPGGLRPAELAFLTPEVPDTLLLEELT